MRITVLLWTRFQLLLELDARRKRKDDDDENRDCVCLYLIIHHLLVVRRYKFPIIRLGRRLQEKEGKIQVETKKKKKKK